MPSSGLFSRFSPSFRSSSYFGVLPSGEISSSCCSNTILFCSWHDFLSSFEDSLWYRLLYCFDADLSLDFKGYSSGLIFFLYEELRDFKLPAVNGLAIKEFSLGVNIGILNEFLFAGAGLAYLPLISA